MRNFGAIFTALLALLIPGQPVFAQEIAPAPSPLSWTDWADLALASPIVIIASVDEVDRLSRKEAPDVPTGEVRAVVTGKLTAALRSPGILPGEAAWLWQGKATAKGRAPIAKKDQLIVFATPLSGGSDPTVQPLRLSAAHGQQPWSPENEATVRVILTDALKPASRGLLVTGIRDAFRGEGDIPGFSESQFFLSTERGRPVALVVKRAPGKLPEILASSGDLVDQAQPITRETFLWRGLACGMPQALPAALAADTGLARDYAAARRSIGSCGRTVVPPAGSVARQ